MSVINTEALMRDLEAYIQNQQKEIQYCKTVASNYQSQGDFESANIYYARSETLSIAISQLIRLLERYGGEV